MSITLYDAVTAAHIPANAEYAAYYTDGSFANHTAVAAHVPHAKLLSITVHGGDADCCDCETGDLTVPEAVLWVEKRLAAGQYRPCVYANLDSWENQGLASQLARFGNQIRRWVAHYDNIASIPSGYDGKQYATGNVDTSIMADDFFASKPKPPDHAHGKAHFEGSFDIESGKWTIHGIPGIGVHFAGEQRWASAEIQLQVGKDEGGHWRVRGMEWNAKPLGS